MLDHYTNKATMLYNIYEVQFLNMLGPPRVVGRQANGSNEWAKNADKMSRIESINADEWNGSAGKRLGRVGERP